MSLILSIETSSKNCSVSLSKDGALLDLVEENNESFSHAENLHIFCEKIINKAGLSFSKIDAYAFSEGPGSYTGLRIGAATVKGFAFCFDKPVILISTLKAMAYAHKKRDRWLCPLMDSRKGEVYMALYNSNMKALMEPQSHVISEKYLREFLKDHKISFFGTGLKKVQEFIKHENAHFISDVFPSSKYLIELAHLKYSQEDFSDISNFEPLYLKEFIPTKQKKNII
mgnify:FL=1|tara:strand:+ start:474 stop:1154 length:681 start_codon:yes stop_codon:yes gene_type:complete